MWSGIVNTTVTLCISLYSCNILGWKHGGSFNGQVARSPMFYGTCIFNGSLMDVSSMSMVHNPFFRA